MKQAHTGYKLPDTAYRTQFLYYQCNGITILYGHYFLYSNYFISLFYSVLIKNKSDENLT